MSDRNTVFIKKFVDIYNEYDADAAITPGDLVEITATGVKRNATADGACLKMFAREDWFQGKTIEDAYAAADKITCGICVPGEEVQANLADGESVALGDFLASNGAGKLQAVGSGGTAIAVALEAVDMSGSAGEDPSGLIKVVIL